jgi:hypothetical protein
MAVLSRSTVCLYVLLLYDWISPTHLLTQSSGRSRHAGYPAYHQSLEAILLFAVPGVILDPRPSTFAFSTAWTNTILQRVDNVHPQTMNLLNV